MIIYKNALPNPLMSSVKTPGSLSFKHQSPALVAIFNFFSTGSSTCFCCQHSDDVELGDRDKS